MKKYVLGLDGGGTKTHAALFDIEGNLVDIMDWGPTNHEVLEEGFSQLSDEMKGLLSFLLQKNSIEAEDLAVSAFGMAGVDTRRQHDIISGIIRDLGIQHFILTNDAYLGVKAGCPTGIGICVINGTGCTVAGIDENDAMIQIGGQGSLTGDVGGGSEIGMAAIRRVYDYLFRLESHTVMADIMFEQLGISSKFDFMEVVPVALENGTLRLNGLGEMVFDAANMNDEAAISILDYVGRELGRSVNGAIYELSFRDKDFIQVVLAGSVNVKGKNPSLVNGIKNQVISCNSDKKVDFIVLKQPPVTGAVIWALERVYKGDDLFDKVTGQLR